MKYLLLFIILFSCSGKYYKLENLKIEKDYSYIYGTFSFLTNNSFLPSRMALTIKDKQNEQFLTYFLFSSGDYFLIPFKSGNYEIFSLTFMSAYTYETYDSMLIKKPFYIKENEILYFGNFENIISYDIEYIYWGIARINDHFEEDIKILTNKYPFFSNYEINKYLLNATKIKKLKYSPASIGTN